MKIIKESVGNVWNNNSTDSAAQKSAKDKFNIDDKLYSTLLNIIQNLNWARLDDNSPVVLKFWKILLSEACPTEAPIKRLLNYQENNVFPIDEIVEIVLRDNNQLSAFSYNLCLLITALLLKYEAFYNNEKLLQLFKKCYGLDKETLKQIAITLLSNNEFKERAIENYLKEVRAPEQNNLDEDIEKHEKLNPVLWNDDNSLKEEVKTKIEEIVDIFVEDLAENNITINIDDIILIGSNASYNYTKDSDLDIHIITNTKSLDYPEELIAALYGAYRSIFNSKYEINFYNIPIELYVETEDSARISNGVYSVKNNKWIQEPQPQDIPELDEVAFNKLLNKWEIKYNNLIDSYEADLLEDEKEVIKLIDDIYAERKSGLASDGEYGLSNLLFKEFRNKGYLDNLKDIKNKLVSKRLSLKEGFRPLAFV